MWSARAPTAKNFGCSDWLAYRITITASYVVLTSQIVASLFTLLSSSSFETFGFAIVATIVASQETCER